MARITVDIISEKEFSIEAKGYSRQEVDNFLDDICEEMERMEEEIKDLRQKTTAVHVQQPAHQEIAQEHIAVKDQDLDQDPGEIIAEGVKVPAQEADAERAQVRRADDVDPEIQVRGADPGAQICQQQRQAHHMYRDPAEGRSRLPAAHGAEGGLLFLVHHALAFRCSSKSRFMPSMGVSVFRSISSRARRSASFFSPMALISSVKRRSSFCS